MLMIASGLQSGAKVTEIDDIWDIQYNNRPMVIEAYASWCQPCRIYSPIVERLSREYEGKVDFYKVDVDNPDAVDFIDRYEVNSVPLTVFLWDPLGDATVKHSVQQGLMGYDELKYYIEETMGKQYRPREYSQPYTFNWESGAKYEGADTYTPRMAPFEGEWQGVENGFQSKLWFYKRDNEFEGYGGTLNPSLYSLVGTVYWLTLGFGWDDEKDTLFLSDVLPSEPTSTFSRINNGKFRMRYFKMSNGRLNMEVEEYTVNNGQLSSAPSHTYTVEYQRCK